MKSLFLRALLAPAIAVMASQGITAADFHPISSVATSTGGDLWPVSNLIQGPGNGYAAGGEHEQLGSGASHRWVTAAPGGFPSDYIEQTGKPVLVFDLGEDRTLSEISVWGYTTTNANGVSRFSLRFATAAEGEQQFSASISYNPFFDSVIDDAPRQSFAFSEVVTARYVEFTCEDNFYANGGSGPPGGGDRVGLGEVAFADAVPDPHPILAVQAVLDFGNVASDPGAVTLPLSISNAGSDLPLELTSTMILTNATGSEHFSVSGVPDFIAAGEAHEFTVTFDSGGAEGCFNAQLELGSNDPAQPLTSLLLKAGINCVSPEPGKPTFSVEGGTFVEDLALELSTPTPGAQILYTTDGSLPSLANGMVYDGSIPITGTVQIRAATFSGDQPPAIATESFVRLAPDLAGYESGLPIVIIENFGQGSVPNKGWSTGSQTGGGLIQPERQSAYLRIIATDPMTGMASISAPAETDSRIGIRVRGAFSSTWNPKPYSLETWKQNGDDDRKVRPLGLPKESDWILYYPHPNYDRSMLNNTFIWALSGETGRYGTRFRFVDVFVNESGGSLRASDRRGVYAFAEKVARGNDRIDFEALSEDGRTGGWLLGINRMDPEPISGYPTGNGATSPQFFHTAGPNRDQQTAPNVAGRGDDIPRQYNAFINFENPNGYRINDLQRRVIELWFRRFENVLYDEARWRNPATGYRNYLNTRDFIDYFHLLNLAKQGDGMLLSVFPWVSSGVRKLHMGPMWDFNNGAYGSSPTSTLFFRADRLWYPRLFDDPDYMQEHIDRWYELRRGPLADDNMVAIIDRQSAQIPAALVRAQGLSVNSWNSRLQSMKSYLITRAAWIDGQFSAPPDFSEEGGIVGAGVSLIIRKPGNVQGVIYYTLDGRDPRLPGGGILAGARIFGAPIALSTSVQVRARIRTTAGEWSALNDATFVVGIPADSTNLAISEVMYHPAAPNGLAEYIELLNIADTPIDLTGAAFSKGISFAFPAGLILVPGARILVVADQAVFESLYGTNPRIAGEFPGDDRLQNGGERIELIGADAELIRSFRFNDRTPWPKPADGGGFSLVLIDPGSNPDHDDPAHWRRSGQVGGAPGREKRVQFVGDPNADGDRDGRSALLEYYFGISDENALDAVQGLQVAVDASGELAISFPHNADAEDAVGVVEFSGDLVQWVATTDLVGPEVSAEATPVETWHFTGQSEQKQFVRLRVTISSAD